MPANKTMRRIKTAIALFVFTAHNPLIVWKPSIRQILECLFDFIVFQFDTSSERKKGRNL